MRRFLVLLFMVTGFVPVTAAQELSAVISNSGGWVSRFQPVEFILNRPLAGAEHLELVMGTTDVSDLCTIHDDTLLYQPQAVPLSPGSQVITLSVITPDGKWKLVGTFSLNVLTPNALEREAITPSLSLANKGQPAEDHFPDGVGGGRKRFQELNGQLGLKMEAERAGLQASLGFNLVGVSFRQEAIRFAEKREDASKIDLSSYLLEARVGTTALSVGHILHGRERHLLNGFASRGISVSSAVTSFADFSVAVVNATNIVGWDNLAGVDNPRHRIYSGTLGLEFLPSKPGLVRVEASYSQGSQLPISNFNQGQIPDAEQSKGGALRLSLADPSHTVSVDAGIARARFTNPSDPLLSQQLQLAPTERTTRWARYADVSWDALRDEMLFNILATRLTLAFRHERVDPLYRVVGVAVRSDILSNTYEAHGGLGPLQVDFTHLRSEDNLADIPSILKTFTRQSGVNAAFLPAALPGTFPSWTPTLSYGLNVTHQFGDGVPSNSDMTATRVPDQVTTSQTGGIEWQSGSVRAGYRGTYTFQDNRQVGQENMDVVNRTHSLSLSVSVLAQTVLTVDGSLESLENRANSAVVRTRRISLGISTFLFRGLNTNINGSLSRSKDNAGSNSQTQGAASCEASYSFDLSRSFVFNWRGQLFVRYAWNEAVSINSLFDLRSRTRAWLITTGLSFNLF